MTIRRMIPLRLALIILTLAAGSAAPGVHASTGPAGRIAQNPPGLIVVRVYYTDRADLAQLAARLDVWEIHAPERYIVAAVDEAELQSLIAQGYRIDIDFAKTIEANQPRLALPGQVNGIPGFACYRTVEETFATAQSIVTNHPDLAEWIDVGDSWLKATSGGSSGYDLLVLRLTNHNIPGPKPRLFIMSSVHAREYTPAELNTRFAEYLINNYGIDPDATWLLDDNEIHLLLQANPDGRKQAEAGLLWRKNVDNNYCANTNSRGADLNRNYPFQWGGIGSSGNQCDETYRGPSAASEPETQAVVNYIRSQYPDLRSDDLTSAAPITTSGIFLDLHSYSQLVLWPWGFANQVAPNGPALQTLGRKFAYFNNYTPQQSIGLYPTDGTTDDTAYGELGVAAFTFEMGTAFFQDCATFQNTILPDNLQALIYAAKAARQPYQTPAGPDALNLTATPTTTVGGAQVILNATANDTRYSNSNGVEPVQDIAGARYTIDAPSWATNVVTYPMRASDGNFDSPIESIQTAIDTTCLSAGRHIVFIEARDAAGNWGVPTATYIERGPGVSIIPAAACQSGPLGSTVTYTLQMSNTSSVTDTFALGASGHAWLTQLSPLTATLAPSRTEGLIVSVTIPVTASVTASDTALITMAGSGAPAYSVLRTTVYYQYTTYLPIAIKDWPPITLLPAE